ncbi:hypothetical protein, partial [Mycobacteroides abscessus]
KSHSFTATGHFVFTTRPNSYSIGGSRLKGPAYRPSPAHHLPSTYKLCKFGIIQAGSRREGNAMLDDLLAARAAIAICERLLDNPDDLDALDAARQLIDDNMPWVKLGRQLVDSAPD